MTGIARKSTHLLDVDHPEVESGFGDAHVRAAAFQGWHSSGAGALAGSAAEKLPPQHSRPGPLAIPVTRPVGIDVMM